MFDQCVSRAHTAHARTFNAAFDVLSINPDIALLMLSSDGGAMNELVNNFSVELTTGKLFTAVST